LQTFNLLSLSSSNLIAESDPQKAVVPNVKIWVHKKQQTVPAASLSTSFVTVVAIKQNPSKFSSALEILTAQLITVSGFLP